MLISASLQAWGVVFPFAMLTSICRSIVTICSGLYLLIGMTRFSSKWILSHSTWYKFRRSRHSEGRAIAAHRFNCVVVRRLRRKVHHRHAVDHVREILIPPIERFCPATEVLGVGAVVHYRVLDRAAASIGHPSDNGGMIRRRFQCRSLDDLHACGFLTSGRLRGSNLAGEHRDADRNRYRK